MDYVHNAVAMYVLNRKVLLVFVDVSACGMALVVGSKLILGVYQVIIHTY